MFPTIEPFKFSLSTPAQELSFVDQNSVGRRSRARSRFSILANPQSITRKMNLSRNVKKKRQLVETTKSKLPWDQNTRLTTPSKVRKQTVTYISTTPTERIPRMNSSGLIDHSTLKLGREKTQRILMLNRLQKRLAEHQENICNTYYEARRVLKEATRQAKIYSKNLKTAKHVLYKLKVAKEAVARAGYWVTTPIDETLKNIRRHLQNPNPKSNTETKNNIYQPMDIFDFLYNQVDISLQLSHTALQSIIKCRSSWTEWKKKRLSQPAKRDNVISLCMFYFFTNPNLFFYRKFCT